MAGQSRSRRQGVVVSPEEAERIEAGMSPAAEASRDQRFAQFDVAFRAEKIDATWAPEAEQDLVAVGMTDSILAIEASPPTHRRIECRARTCRLHFSFKEQGDAEDWSTAYATSVGRSLSQLQYMVQRQPDGSAKVTMFGVR